jgi:hypothetical protein
MPALRSGVSLANRLVLEIPRVMRQFPSCFRNFPQTFRKICCPQYCTGTMSCQRVGAPVAPGKLQKLLDAAGQRG